MTWIKVRTDLPQHPKVVRISSALNADRLRTVGALHRVWCLFDQYSVDGRIEGYTPELIDQELGWPGFSSTMAEVGWLEVGEGYCAIPRFDVHNGQSAKRRATDAERKRLGRSGESVRNVSARDADEQRTKRGPEKNRKDSSLRSERARAGELQSPRPDAEQTCAVMRGVGIEDVQPGDPRLLALLDQGLTRDEALSAAMATVAKQPRPGNAFAYALGVIEGRRRDAAGIQLPSTTGHDLAEDLSTKGGVDAAAKRLGLVWDPTKEQRPQFDARVRQAVAAEVQA